MTKADIIGKVRIHGTVKLGSPVLISAGGAGEEWRHESDIYVLRDKKERPFIPGTSIAGVLRRYVRDIDDRLEDLLFGYADRADGSLQSAVNIKDIVLEHAEITVRDGVSIDAYTGTGIAGAKYNYEAVERGAEGELDMSVTIRSYHAQQYPGLKDAVKRIADLLAGGIRLGALTSKGFGFVQCRNVQADFYDFHRPEDVRDWLLKKAPSDRYRGNKADMEASPLNFLVQGEFALKTSLLVRDGDVGGDDDVHAVQLKSGDDFLIPGTTVKGVLRHQAMYILRRLGKSEQTIRDLMGYADKESQKKSRFITAETYFRDGAVEAKQTRNAIDRFTGSTIESKLFAEKPVWPVKKHAPVLRIAFAIEHCSDWEAGLALLLLKDLWNGRTAVGGGAAVGRGYLQGLSAQISFKGQQWKMLPGGRVEGASAGELNRFVTAFVQHEG